MMKEKRISILKINNFKAVTGFIILWISVLVSLGSICTLEAVTYIPVDWGYCDTASRGLELFYHNNRIDQLWYGTNRWAVRFDIKDHTTVTDSLTLQEINIFFPNGDGTFSVEIYNDQSRPLENLLLTYDNLPVAEGWNTITLPESDYLKDTVFWIVINFETDETGNFMTASSTGGHNSYYWVPESDGIPEHFISMEESNIVSEFLVTLTGKLNLDGNDLELTSFSLSGDASANGQVYPVFTVTNNSESHINDPDGVRLAIDMNNTSPDQIFFRAFSFPVDLAPNESAEYIMDNQAVYLSRFSCQYQLSVHLEYSEDVYPDNNILNYTFNTFTEHVKYGLLENFIRKDHQTSKDILANQDTFTDPNLVKLNYFFHQEDQPYYTNESALKKDYYKLNGYPFTIVNGIESIIGYTSNYSQELKQSVENTKSLPTFIETNPKSEVKQYNPSTMILSVAFELVNTSSYVLASTLENLRIFVALTEKNIPELPGNTLVHLETNSKTLSLNYADSFLFEWDINLQTIRRIERELIPENFSEFQLVYWVQDIKNKKIYYTATFNLEETKLNTGHDPLEPVPFNISVHPNPFTPKSMVQLDISGEKNDEVIIQDVAIFNIKGQLIKQLKADPNGSYVWSGTNEYGLPVSNGIYLFKVEAVQRNQSGTVKLPSQYKVLSFVK